MGASIFAWSLPIFVVAALALSIIRPAERPRIRSAVLLLALALIGLLTAAVLASSGVNPAKSSYKWVSWAARFLLWISFVNVASVFVFEVFLNALRLQPPRIMRDLLLALTYIVVGFGTLSKDVDITGIVATSAVITAVIGLGGLGELILEGLVNGFRTPLLVASVLSVLLALVADLSLAGAQRLAIPWSREH